MRYQINTTNPIVRDAVYTRLFEMGFVMSGNITSLAEAKRRKKYWDTLWNFALLEDKNVMGYTSELYDVKMLTLDYFFSDDFEIQIKPKYRAWESKDVPVGKLIKNLEWTYGVPSLILDAFSGGIRMYDLEGDMPSKISFEKLLEHYQYSYDGLTWFPCGIKIN